MRKRSNSKRATDQRMWFAIDWLLNSRHTADPDIQRPFWAYVDGLISEAELDEFSAADVEQREKRIEQREAGEPR